MGKINSREKGARFERELAKRLREYGYDAIRGVQHSGERGNPDVKTNMPHIHIEAKNVERLNIWNALAQSKRDARDDEMATVMFKKNRTDIYVAMPLDEWMELYKAWEKEQENGRDAETD